VLPFIDFSTWRVPAPQIKLMVWWKIYFRCL